MKPYYQDKWVTIYNGDCREILPQLDVKVDLVLTDPPYPNEHLEYMQTPIDFLNLYSTRQLLFWTARIPFPLNYSALHVWDKKTGGNCQFEFIYERNGAKQYRIYHYYFVNSVVAANYTHDVFNEHPSQKPQLLITKLLQDYSDNNSTVLDPFLGSGTTCYCAKKLNRYSIGIEIE